MPQIISGQFQFPLYIANFICNLWSLHIIPWLSHSSTAFIALCFTHIHTFAPRCHLHWGICYSMWCTSVINEARLNRPPGTNPRRVLTCRQVTITVANLSQSQPIAQAKTCHHGKTVTAGASSVTNPLYPLLFDFSLPCLNLKSSVCMCIWKHWSPSLPAVVTYVSRCLSCYWFIYLVFWLLNVSAVCLICLNQDFLVGFGDTV